MTTTTDTTTARPTLADRARAERDRVHKAAAESTAQLAAEEHQRILDTAQILTMSRFGETAAADWTIVDHDNETVAEVTIEGLRFQYVEDATWDNSSYDLVTDCEVCRADVRRAQIDAGNGLRSLAGLLDRPADPVSAQRWTCRTCTRRAWEAREAAAETAELSLTADQRTEIDAPAGHRGQAATVAELLARAERFADDSQVGDHGTQDALTSIAYSLVVIARDTAHIRQEVER